MIKIHTEKKIIYETKKRKVISIEMLKKDQLPKEYVMGFPHCFLNDTIFYKKNCIVYKNLLEGNAYIPFTEILLIEGNEVTEYYFRQVLKKIFECGSRLLGINEIKKDEITPSVWGSHETISI